MGPRELRQPNGKIDVGAWIVDAPVGSIAVRALRKDNAAEIEAAVEALRRCHSQRRPTVPETATALCERGSRRCEQRRKRGGGSDATSDRRSEQRHIFSVHAKGKGRREKGQGKAKGDKVFWDESCRNCGGGRHVLQNRRMCRGGDVAGRVLGTGQAV